MHTAATWGVVGSPGSGAIALAHSERTLRSVSAPSRVVRSIMLIAASMAQALDVVLIERVPNPAARASAPTWSTPGSPCSHLVSEALVSAPTPSSSRALAVAVVELTGGVYRPARNPGGRWIAVIGHLRAATVQGYFQWKPRPRPSSTYSGSAPPSLWHRYAVSPGCSYSSPWPGTGAATHGPCSLPGWSSGWPSRGRYSSGPRSCSISKASPFATSSVTSRSRGPG